MSRAGGTVRLSRIFGDNLSRIFTRPLKTLGEKYFRAVQKPDETFRTSRLGLRPKHENRRREGCFAAETTQAWRGSTGEWTLSRRHAVFPSPSRPSPRLARVVSPFGPSPRRRTRNAPRHERSRKHASFRRSRHEAKSIRSGFVVPSLRHPLHALAARPFPLLVGTAYYSGTNGRTPFRSLALPRVTRIAPCGVFVTFRDAKRFVFRARTNPKDAAPCRRRGEGRANSVSNEAKPNGRMLPSTAVSGTALQRRSRPFGREFSCFSPKGSAVRADKQLPQRGKPHFSAAMANQE